MPKRDGLTDGLELVLAASCCLLYTSDAADEEDSVDLGGRRNFVELIQDAKGLEQALALTRQLAQALNRQLGRLFWASEAV